MTIVSTTSYEPAVKGKQRLLLNPNRLGLLGIGLLMAGVPTFLMSLVPLVAFSAELGSPALAIVSGFGFTLTASGGFIEYKISKLRKAESRRMTELITQNNPQLISLAHDCNESWSQENGGIWVNPADSTVNHITYNNQTDKIEITTKVVPKYELDRLNTIKRLITESDTALYAKEVHRNLAHTDEQEELTSTEKLALDPSHAHTNLSAVHLKDWATKTKKAAPTELAPTITEIKALVTAAAAAPVNTEEDHTLQRLLNSTAEATSLYQSLVTAASALPNSEELTTEARTVLSHTLTTLKTEAELLVATQATTAMEKLRMHASYVDSGSRN